MSYFCSVAEVKAFIGTNSQIRGLTDTDITTAIPFATEFVYNDLSDVFTKDKLDEWITDASDIADYDKVPLPIRKLAVFKTLFIVYKKTNENMTIQKNEVTDLKFFEKMYEEYLHNIRHGIIAVYDITTNLRLNYFPSPDGFSVTMDTFDI